MSLSSRIQKTFADVPRPADESIFACDSEGAETAFLGRRWDEVSGPDLHYHTFALLAFTASAFVYYLPAFMIASLESRSSDLPDAVVDRLCPPKYNPKRPSYQKWWSLLSKEQRLCVIDFLEEFRSDNPQHYDSVITSLRNNVEG